MIIVKEVRKKKELLRFVKFPFQLYKNSPYWVPPIIKEELHTLDKTKNPVFKNAEARLFLAYKDSKIAGRIAAIINHLEIPKQKKLRFGWFEVIDDIEVTKALFNTIFEYGKQQELEYAEGPCGFSNMDKAGMLIDGFDKVNNMTTHYNPVYYPKHLEELGFTKRMDWVEYSINTPEKVPDKVKKFSELVLKRYQLTHLKFNSSKELLRYADNMFDLMNRAFESLPSFSPIQPYQVEIYKKKYLKFIHPDFIDFIADKDDKLVAFSITMPSFAKALQKARGRLFPFGFIHLLRARKKNDTGNLYLIGVDPEYQGKGLTAVIFQSVMINFNKRKIKYVETNPELEENTAVQALWKDYDPKLFKRWRTYKKIL